MSQAREKVAKKIFKIYAKSFIYLVGRQRVTFDQCALCTVVLVIIRGLLAVSQKPCLPEWP